MDNLENWIQSGGQIGKRFSFEIDGRVFWSSVGLQFHEGKYKAYVDEIAEDQMVAEEFLREEGRSFSSYSEAGHWIDLHTRVKCHELLPCKGQKVFNPEFVD